MSVNNVAYHNGYCPDCKVTIQFGPTFRHSTLEVRCPKCGKWCQVTGKSIYPLKGTVRTFGGRTIPRPKVS
jgi:phage FluMu protein Com